MARNTSFPQYRRQQSANTDRAFVELNGHRVYLGMYGSPESKTAYHRVLAEWIANDNQQVVAKDELTIVELAARFWQHANQYYARPDGTQTSEVSCFKQVIKILKEMYGPMRVSEFGPLALKAVRQKMIEKGWMRTTINSQIGRLKIIFRWGVGEELVDVNVLQALRAVPGLKLGRCNVPEPEPVRPVLDAHIEAVRPHVSRQIWALIQLQLLTSARPGELARLRPIDLNTSEDVWTYHPQQHKTAHHGRDRRIIIGPRAQQLLRPFLAECPISDFLFSPERADAERRTAKHAERKTPLGCGNSPGTNKVARPQRRPGAHYTRDSYRRAIARACRKAGIPKWHPHQLRHNAATRLRAEFGLEAAQIMLGHAHADVTEIYAETSNAKAVQIAQKIG
jgi:integrase